MYEQFYNLKVEPFRLSPDHRFCFTHSSYAKAKAYMQYAFKRAEGFVMITGRPGTGKTTLVNDLVQSLSSQQAKIAMLVCTQLEAEDLLRMVADAFGIPTTNEQKSVLLQRLTKLFTLCHTSGRRSLLIIDEAQDLSNSALEELRLLTNLQINGQPLLQIFLLGQDELRNIVKQPSMEQLHQRLVAACHLKALDPDETKSYIKHRLTQVGWKGDPAISEAVYPIIHKFSEGIPRRINMLCSRLFLHGCVEEKHQLGIIDAKLVLEEIMQEQLTSDKIPSDLDFDIEDSYEILESANVEALQVSKKKTSNSQANQSRLAASGGLTAATLPQKETPTHISQVTPIPKKGEYLTEAREGGGSGKTYKGPESRAGARRLDKDRREMVRYNPNKEDRRKTPGRRKEDIVDVILSRRIWGEKE